MSTPDARPRSARAGRRDILAAALLWSVAGIVTKVLPLDPLTIAFYRGLFAGLALLPFVPRAHRVFRPVMLPLGLVFGAMTGLFLAAIKAGTAANAIYLQYSATFWVVPIAFLALGERPARRDRLGIVFAMAGIAVIVGFDTSAGVEGRRGILFGLGSGIGYACVVVGMRGLRGLDPLWLSAVNNLLGTLALGAWMTATIGPPPIPGAGQALALATFGAIQMAIPYALFARGLRTVSAPEAGLITLVEPILNPVWVALLTHERPSDPSLLGGLFLILGVAARYLTPMRDDAPADSKPSGLSEPPP